MRSKFLLFLLIILFLFPANGYSPLLIGGKKVIEADRIIVDDSLEIPHADAPTINTTGEIALDTSLAGHQPLLRYYDGDEIMTVIAIPSSNLNTDDNYIIKYDAAGDKFQMEADAGAAGVTAWDDITNPDANDEIDFGSYTIELNVENFQIGRGDEWSIIKFDGSPNLTFSGSADIDLPDDSVDEADLKIVDAAADEAILTSESTTGDFEWHTPSELITCGSGVTWTGTTINLDNLFYTSIDSSEITDDTISEADLDMTDSATDEDVLTYESGAGGSFEWHSKAELGIGVATSIQDDLITNEDFADDDWGELSVSSNIVHIDADVITVEDLASDDWGEISISSNIAHIDDDVVVKANFGTEDWGDLSVSSNLIYIDDDAIDKANFSTEDWGDMSVSSNLVYLDNDVTDENVIYWGTAALQVSASDILIRDASDYFHATEAEGAIHALGFRQTEITCNTLLSEVNVSSTVTNGTWTVSITQPDSLTLEFNIDRAHLDDDDYTMSVDASQYAGSNATPKTVYFYVKNTAGSPELVASRTFPSAIASIDVAHWKAGFLDSTSINLYGGHSDSMVGYEIIYDSYFRAWDQGTIYESGLDTIVTSANITIASGDIKTIFTTETTEQKVVGTDGYFQILNNNSYSTATSFAFTEYSTGESIGANKYYNVVFGIVEDHTNTHVMALVQRGDTIPAEYITTKAAVADEYGTLVTQPTDTLLRKLFVPVCRVVVKNDANDWLQQIPTAGSEIYAIDLRGGIGGGGGSVSIAGAPSDANYLVGTANDSLSAEIIVGTTPGGELGNTWASPTIDDDAIDKANLKTEDWGDISVSSNLVYIDDDAIDKANFSTENWGDVSVSSNLIRLETGVVSDNEIDYSAVTLTDFDYQTNWRMFYSDGSGDVQELGIAGDGTFLESNGSSASPAFRALAYGDIPDLSASYSLVNGDIYAGVHNFAAGATIVLPSSAVTSAGQITDDIITNVHFTTTDWGDVSVSSNLVRFDADVVAVAEMANADHGMVSWSGGSATIEDFALDAAADAGDQDILSLDRLEGVDAGIYLDLGGNGTMAIAADARIVIRGSGTLDLEDTALDCDNNTVTLSTVVGAINAGGATSLEIPHSDAPTINTTGEIVLDTAITGHQPMVKYYDGDQEMVVIAIPSQGLLVADNYIVKYDSTKESFWMEADSAGSGVANLTLNNLAVVAVNTGLHSDAANIDDLGTVGAYWKKLFLAQEIEFAGSSNDAYQTKIVVTEPTGSDKTITLPNSNQTVGTATSITDDLILNDDFADRDWGMVNISSNLAHVQDFLLTTDADAGDNDIKSLDLLEGVDSGIFIEMGTNGSMILSADARIITRGSGVLDLEDTALDCDGNTVTLSTLAGAIDAGGATSLEIPNTAGHAVCNAGGEIAYDEVGDQLVVYDSAGGEIAADEAVFSPIKHLSLVCDPGSWYDSDAEIFMMTIGDEAPNGIIIDEWKLSCNVDPDVEINADLRRATSWFPVFASSADIDEIDTTSGASSEDTDANINGGAVVANGQVLYIAFDADPEGTCTQMIFELWFHLMED